MGQTVLNALGDSGSFVPVSLWASAQRNLSSCVADDA